MGYWDAGIHMGIRMGIHMDTYGYIWIHHNYYTINHNGYIWIHMVYWDTYYIICFHHWGYTSSSYYKLLTSRTLGHHLCGVAMLLFLQNWIHNPVEKLWFLLIFLIDIEKKLGKTPFLSINPRLTTTFAGQGTRSFACTHRSIVDHHIGFLVGHIP